MHLSKDIHTLDSGWGPTMYPVVVGHEIVGTVRAKGANVSDEDFKIGECVGVGAQGESGLVVVRWWWWWSTDRPHLAHHVS